MIDPASKLIEMHVAHKKDPTKPQTEEVLSITYTRGVSRAGNDMITAEVTTPRRKFPIRLLEHTTWLAQKRMAFSLATDDFTKLPRTITYVKKGDFWEALGFGAPTDDEQLKQRLAV